jgi:hypothetical protein
MPLDQSFQTARSSEKISCPAQTPKQRGKKEE